MKSLSKKRSSLGSLTSLNDKPSEIDLEKKLSYHKASRSLDLDLDIVSTEATNDSKSSKLGHEKSTMNGNISPNQVMSQPQPSNRQSLARGGAVKVNTSEILDRVRETGRLLAAERQERVVVNGGKLMRRTEFPRFVLEIQLNLQ